MQLLVLRTLRDEILGLSAGLLALKLPPAHAACSTFNSSPPSQELLPGLQALRFATPLH